MDFSAFKNPLVLAALAGSVIVTNIVTYNVSAPSAGNCAAEISTALEAINQRMAEEEAVLRRALEPVEGLNPNRTGAGLGWMER